MVARYIPRATEAGLSRVLRCMSAAEARLLRDTARATRQDVAEVVGRVAARGDMWEFIELVLAPDQEPVEDDDEQPVGERGRCPDCGLPGSPKHDEGCPALGSGGAA